MHFLHHFTSNKSWTKVQLLVPFLALAILSKCSSGSQSQSEDPVTQGSSQGSSQNVSLNGGPSDEGGETAQEGASVNNAVANTSGGNFGTNGNGFGNNGNGGGNIANGGSGSTNLGEDDAAAIGASLNNALPEETVTQTANAGLNSTNTGLNGGNPPAVPLNNTSQALNQGNLLPAQNAALTETPSEGASAAKPQVPTQAPAPAATQLSSNARAAASPFSNPQMNWPGKGKVKYVTRQVTRHSAPNGPVVGEFEKGDHPLIYQNGNWVELHDGSFVKGNGLSEQAVGYGKGQKSWQ